MADPYLDDSDLAFLGLSPGASKPNPANEAYWRKRLANQGQIKAAPRRPLWRRFIDNLQHITEEYGPAPIIGDVAAPLVETGDGTTVAQRRAANVQRRRQRREDFSAIEPPSSAGEYAADIAGSIVGSIISDPTNLIGGPAKTLGGKMFQAAGIGAGLDLAQQAAEVGTGVRDELDPYQASINLAASPTFVGVEHGARRGIERVSAGRRIVRGSRHPSFSDLERTMLSLEGGGTIDRPRVSPKGAKGPYQVMDATARDPGFGIRPWDGKTEADRARVGRQYLAAMTDRYDGDHAKILAAYNAGPGNVDKWVKKWGDEWINHIPFKETRKYVSNGLRKLGREVGPEETPEQFAIRMNDPESGFSEADAVRLQELLNEAVDSDNIVPFRTVSRPSNDDTESTLGPIIADAIDQARLDSPEAFLTPAERQEMDASAVRPEVRGALSEDIMNSIRGQGRAATTPVNDLGIGPKIAKIRYDTAIEKIAAENGLTKNQAEIYQDTLPENHPFIQRFNQLLKDIINNEEGVFRPDELWRSLSDWRSRRAAQEAASVGPSGSNQSPRAAAEDTSLIGRLTAGIREAADLRPEQEILIKENQARQARAREQAGRETSGRRGFYAELAASRGGAERVDFDPLERIFSPEEQDALFDYVKNFNGWTSVFEAGNAREGLEKLMTGRIPSDSEIKLLNEVFPKETIAAILSKTPRSVQEKMADALNIPRAMMSSFDISAPGRQGVLMIGRPEFWSNIPDMIRQFGSEDFHQLLQEEIKQRPNYGRMREAKLATQDFQGELTTKEENFQSNYAEKYVPGIRMSDRAFSGYLHRLRADVFDSVLNAHEAAGVNVDDPKYLRSLGNYINTFTGRGDIPSYLKGAAPILNATLFSPRLMSSRLAALGFSDVGNALRLKKGFYGNLHPAVRKEALKDMSKFAGAAASLLSLAALGGAAVSLDPTSSDFLKIKVGNKRWDILGGLQQYMVMAARLAKGAAIRTGLMDDIKGFEKTNLLNAPARFLRTKLAPVPAYAVDAWFGKNLVGEEFDLLWNTLGLFTPMAMGDTFESAVKGYERSGDEGFTGGAAAASPSIVGVGYAEYEKRPKETEPISDEEFLTGVFGGSSEENYSEDSLEGLSKEDKEFLGL